VNVRVDVPGQNEFADATDLFTKCGRVLFANRNAFDPIAVNHDRRIRQHFAVGWIDHRRANERNFFGVERRGGK
jgi:hypothetical protein